MELVSNGLQDGKTIYMNASELEVLHLSVNDMWDISIKITSKYTIRVENEEKFTVPNMISADNMKELNPLPIDTAKE